MALARVPALANRRGHGAVCLHGRLLEREGVRRPCLHADVRRPHAWSCAEVVQHGGLRQSRKAGYAPQPTESRSLISWPRSGQQVVLCHTRGTLGAVAAGWEAVLIRRIGNDVLGVGPQPQIVGDDLNERRQSAHRPTQGLGRSLAPTKGPSAVSRTAAPASIQPLMPATASLLVT